MDAIDFLVLQHERLHRQVERDFLHGLSEAQMRLRPYGLNSIAWLVWHMTRCEDALNILMGRSQVLDELPDMDRFRTAGVFREKALWAIVERAGQTKGW
jgi:hypothetical protein